MKAETLSDYVKVGLWLGLLEKTVFFLSGKECEIIDQHVMAPDSTYLIITNKYHN